MRTINKRINLLLLLSLSYLLTLQVCAQNNNFSKGYVSNDVQIGMSMTNGSSDAFMYNNASWILDKGAKKFSLAYNINGGILLSPLNKRTAWGIESGLDFSFNSSAATSNTANAISANIQTLGLGIPVSGTMFLKRPKSIFKLQAGVECGFNFMKSFNYKDGSGNKNYFVFAKDGKVMPSIKTALFWKYKKRPDTYWGVGFCYSQDLGDGFLKDSQKIPVAIQRSYFAINLYPFVFWL